MLAYHEYFAFFLFHTVLNINPCPIRCQTRARRFPFRLAAMGRLSLSLTEKRRHAILKQLRNSFQIVRPGSIAAQTG
jgi:hypothetical protein